MTIIVDASVALKWFMEELESDAARRVLESGELLVAPDLIVVEACNGAWKAVRKDLMTAAQADFLSHRLAATIDELYPAAGLAPLAMSIARRLDHPVYDCFYLALAEQREATMVTADRRLITRVRGTPWDGRVRALADAGGG